MSDELSHLRGAVRDGVASIENLANVLASRRVGPKVIARALPEVRNGCATLATAFERSILEVKAVLAGDAAGGAAAAEMFTFAAARVREFALSLVRREGQPLDARERLALDAAARAVSGEIAGVVHVLDLLSVAIKQRASALELGDLLTQKRPLMGARSAPIAIDVSFGPALTFIADASIVLDLLLLSLGAVVRSGVKTPLLTARTQGDSGRVVLMVERPPSTLPQGIEKRIVDVPMRSPLPRENEVLVAAARRAGIELTCDPEHERICLSLMGEGPIARLPGDK